MKNLNTIKKLLKNIENNYSDQIEDKYKSVKRYYGKLIATPLIEHDVVFNPKCLAILFPCKLLRTTIHSPNSNRECIRRRSISIFKIKKGFLTDRIFLNIINRGILL